jgi:hypothetical protein
MQIVGTLSEVTLSDVARMISQVRQTGTMVVHTAPVRWVSFVAGAIDLVEREDGVMRDRVEAWRKTQDPAEQFRVRKDRLMELILLDGCRAGFEFASGEVEVSGLPPFDLAELEQRVLLTGCPDQHTDRPTDPPADRPTLRHHAAHGAPSLTTAVLVVPRQRDAEPAAHDPVRSRQRALSRLISAVRSR